MARAKNGIPVQAEPVKRDLGPLPENFPGVLLTALAVENVGGVGDFKVTLGAVTVLAGPNGAGKTTVLDAARALLIGGRTDGMLQVGATRGQVRGRLSNGWKVERVFLPGRSTVRVWNEKDVELESPGQRLAEIFDAAVVNPVLFLTGTDADRLRMLEELAGPLPLEAFVGLAETVERITGEALGGWTPAMGAPRWPQANALHDLAYTGRTSIGRELKRAEGTVARLGDMPATGADPSQAEQDARKDLAEATEKLANSLRGVDKAEAAEVERVRAKFKVMREAVRGELDPVIGKATAAAATLAEQVKAYQAAAGARELKANAAAEAMDLRASVEALTGVLDQLATLKAASLGTLPVAGLSVDAEGIRWQGIPLARCSKGERAQLAVALMTARSAKAGRLVCVDEAEALDPETRAELIAHAKTAGLQLVLAEVRGGTGLTATAEKTEA